MAQHSDQLYCTLSVRKTYCIRLAFENPCVQRIRYVSTVSHRYTMHNKYCFPYRKLNWWIKSSSLNRRNALFIRWWLVHRWFRLSASAESGEQGFRDTYLIFIMVLSWQTYGRNWNDLKFRTANDKFHDHSQFVKTNGLAWSQHAHVLHYKHVLDREYPKHKQWEIFS